jgi:short-subunit dehydrogenase
VTSSADHHVIITGASSGIGRALAEALALDGYIVWAGVRKPGVLKELGKAYPKTFNECKLDVTSEGDLAALVKKVTGAQPSRVSLINNAGISAGGPVEGVPVETWKKIFDVNLFGVIRTTQVFLPLIRQTKGRIVNIGSISGRVSPPFISIYSGSKYALRAATDSLRVEMRRFGVKVSLVEPGPVKTDIWDKTIAEVTQTWSAMGDEMLKTYDIPLAKVTQMIEKTNSSGVSVDDVTVIVKHALTTASPRAYYPVGRGIRSKRALVAALPTSVRDWIFGLGINQL